MNHPKQLIGRIANLSLRKMDIIRDKYNISKLLLTFLKQDTFICRIIKKNKYNLFDPHCIQNRTLTPIKGIP